MRVLELYSGIGGMHYALQGNLLYCYYTAICWLYCLTKFNLYFLSSCLLQKRYYVLNKIYNYYKKFYFQKVVLMEMLLRQLI